MAQINNSLMSANNDINTLNTNTKKDHKNSSHSAGFKPAAVWESPSFEEFGLCMEVTAYIHQWD